jgi:hypothetical protein
MEMTLAALSQRLRSVPPRCLRDVHPTCLCACTDIVHASDGQASVRWKISVTSDDQHCEVHGERRAMSGRFAGQSRLSGPICVVKNELSIEIFDAILHGFNNEIEMIDCGIVKSYSDNSHLCRREPFLCLHCSSTQFAVEIAVYYAPGIVDTLLDDSSLPSQDMFDTFIITGSCATCSAVNIICEFDGL